MTTNALQVGDLQDLREGLRQEECNTATYAVGREDCARALTVCTQDYVKEALRTYAHEGKMLPPKQYPMRDLLALERKVGEEQEPSRAPQQASTAYAWTLAG